MGAHSIPVVMGDGAAWFTYRNNAAVVAVMTHDGHVSVTDHRADGVPVSAFGGVVFANPAHTKLSMLKKLGEPPLIVARRS
jgi:hypothetical protein